MNVIRCKNGHFFDGDAYGTCPHCGESAMGSSGNAPVKEEKKGLWGWGKKEKEKEKASELRPVVNRIPSVDSHIENTPTDVMRTTQTEEIESVPLKKNPTLDFWQTSSHSTLTQEQPAVEIKETEKSVSMESVINREISNAEIIQPEVKTAERSIPENKPVEMSSLREAVKNASASNEGKTMSYFSTATSVSSAPSAQKQPAEPIVGWLVCVKGCHLGEDFHIYAGKNSIGRSEENRIVIADDNSVSRIKHAMIVYEPKKRNFYLQPGDSSGLTYLNDEYITDSQKLAAYDMIELGDSKFAFIPLCSEKFSWEEHMSKGE